ncbi:Oligopeptide transport ATP-binding protein OppF [Candidatus Calditenuaceae archaeon HR02]|nr:Oligopeptide transport ATP-binding protein OppF [Candidatus Calditenuaceae archaeon HR02]
MGENSILKVENLTKIFKTGGLFFGKKFRAVDDVSFTLGGDSASIFTIVGESGCGKTTLARMILNLIEPTSGSIEILGKRVLELSSKERSRWLPRIIQPVFQNPFESFNPLRKVYPYLIHTAVNVAGVRDKYEAVERVNQALEAVRLSPDIADRSPYELSGGQVQRLSIARAIIPRPKLIVADEPVSMIDASLRMGILNIFKQLKEDLGINFIYITHDLATAYYISDRIAVMYKGSFAEIGEAEAIFREPLHPYTQLLIDSIPRVDRKWAGKVRVAVTEVEEYLLPGCKFADRCPYVMEICKKKAPPLTRTSGGVEVACWLYSDEKH